MFPSHSAYDYATHCDIRAAIPVSILDVSSMPFAPAVKHTMTTFLYIEPIVLQRISKYPTRYPRLNNLPI